MSLTVSGSFPCFSSLDLCQPTCTSGKCYYADYCNGQAASYFCMTFNPYLLAFGALALITLFFLCCIGGIVFFTWRRIRSLRRQGYVIPGKAESEPTQEYNLAVQTRY